MTLEERLGRADSMHRSGGNCAQSVAYALEDLAEIDEETLFRVMEGFGGGMGGYTETCGAVSGAVMAAGWVKSAGSETPISKMETYQLADQMCARFKAQNGTTICSELKGIGNPAGPLRSCPGCIQDAVDIAIDVLQADARAGA